MYSFIIHFNHKINIESIETHHKLISSCSDFVFMLQLNISGKLDECTSWQ